VTFGFRLFDSALTGLGAVYIAALFAIGSGGWFVAQRALTTRSNLLLLAGGGLVVCLSVLGIRAASVIVQHQARVSRLMALGRWSAYMAHDLKNPLAALKGAAQFLLQERALGRSIDDQREFLELLVIESDRLSRLVDHYQRFGGSGVVKERTALNELVRRSLAAEGGRMPGGMSVRLDLQEDLPDCPLDRELFSVALENLLRNALEAMRDGGTLTLRTALARSRAVDASIVVAVEDTGQGMSPRHVAWAFDELFSTKQGGRGLGLALVKHVVDAHGGRVEIASHLGEGTRVALHLPTA
jgi:two-component system, NtrC family, sensor histidine kinase HydH